MDLIIVHGGAFMADFPGEWSLGLRMKGIADYLKSVG